MEIAVRRRDSGPMKALRRFGDARTWPRQPPPEGDRSPDQSDDTRPVASHRNFASNLGLWTQASVERLLLVEQHVDELAPMT